MPLTKSIKRLQYYQKIYKTYKERKIHIIPLIKDTIKLKRRHKMIIGNVPLINSSQLLFYEDLKKCLFDFKPNEVGDCFLQHEDNFALYIQDQQMKNNPQALEECKELLKKNHEKDIDFYAPLNRLYKYKILLHELKKACVKGDIPFQQLIKASDLIEKIICEMNGITAINSIRDENIYLEEQGKLILRDEFKIEYRIFDDYNTLRYDAMVYLFEKSIVFTEKMTEGQARNRRDIYVYRNHIIMKNIGIIVNEESETSFQVYFHGRTKKLFHTLRASDETTKSVWAREINGILMTQVLCEKEENNSP